MSKPVVDYMVWSFGFTLIALHWVVCLLVPLKWWRCSVGWTERRVFDFVTNLRFRFSKTNLGAENFGCGDFETLYNGRTSCEGYWKQLNDLVVVLKELAVGFEKIIWLDFDFMRTMLMTRVLSFENLSVLHSQKVNEMFLVRDYMYKKVSQVNLVWSTFKLGIT